MIYVAPIAAHRFVGLLETVVMATHMTSSLDRVLEPLSRSLTPDAARQILQFHIDADLDARVAVLAERANEGILTAEEHEEYQGIVDAADLVSILKLKARQVLGADGRS